MKGIMIIAVMLSTVTALASSALSTRPLAAQSAQCPSPVGEIVNNFVEVQTLLSDGFAGPASNTLYQPTGETLVVHVDSSTNWEGGAVRALGDVRVGATFQVVGRRLDDCSRIALTVLEAVVATPTIPASGRPTVTPTFPPTGGGHSTTKVPWEWILGAALSGLFLVAAGAHRLRANR
jgi:hypothetical protein